MNLYLTLLVASVFLGSQILSFSTPLAQLTLYRLLAAGLVFIFSYQVFKKDHTLKIPLRSTSAGIVGIYLFWWIWGIISVLWVISLTNWFQAVFLLSLGIISIASLFLWTRDFRHWQHLMNAAWLMITILVFWGLYEITSNNYMFADLEKLDPHNTFASQPWTRIPITTFANQNDYATLLLAYLPINIIKIKFSNNNVRRLFYIIMMALAFFLIYRSESRMILLSLFLFFLIYYLLQFRWEFKLNTIIKITIFVIIISAILIILIPPLREKAGQLIYIAGDISNTGDSRRINLWRNGLLFLGYTFGLGVGAGNIESWMAYFPFLETDSFFNIHNWWLEVFVGYGGLVFILYLTAYGLIIYSLVKIRNKGDSGHRQIANSLISFLAVYIFASITSANNMLIEWHWVFFGLIIAYIKVYEMKYFDKSERLRCLNEFSYHHK